MSQTQFWNSFYRVCWQSLRDTTPRLHIAVAHLTTHLPHLPLLSLISVPLVTFPYWTTCTQVLEPGPVFGWMQVPITDKARGCIDEILGHSHSVVRSKDLSSIFGILMHGENSGHAVGSQLGFSQVEDWIDLQVYGRHGIWIVWAVDVCFKDCRNH